MADTDVRIGEEDDMMRFLMEIQNLSAFGGSLLAITLAVMSKCSLVAPSDTTGIRMMRRLAFMAVSVALMLACTWSAFDPGYVPSWPIIVTVGAVDCLLLVSFVSAALLARRRHRNLIGQFIPH